MWAPRCVKRVDDKVGSQPAQELHDRDAHNALPVELLEGVVELVGRLDGLQRLREDVCVLDGLASALAEVGHHGVHRVPDAHDVAIGPAPEELGRAVVQVPLLHALRGSGVEHSHDLVRPSLVEGFDILHQVLLWIGLVLPLAPAPAGRRLLSSRRQSEEGVPLHPTVAHVRGHKVPLRPDVHLVTCIVVVVRLEYRLPSKNGVTAVRAPLPTLAVGGRLLDLLAVHLGADRAPDPVAPHQHVRLGSRPVLEADGDALSLPLGNVTVDSIAVLDKVGLDLLTLVDQDLLQVRSVNNARVRKPEQVGATLQGELYEPVGRCLGIEEVIQRVVRHPEAAVGAQAVLDPARPRSRKGELLHDAIK
mmetsp:Transcript_53942/g.114600  ORF Transcript_53942/g.114600 Transcript_53942/m.114600 type:complete len:362 (+) Transcript_53942:673-1758(+)